MYGSDPLGVLTWRFAQSTRAATASRRDLLSHSVDLAHMLVGRSTRVVGIARDVHHGAPAARSRAAGHYGRGAPGDPTGPVTNEDYVGALVDLRERRARHVRVVAHDGRPREPDGLRRVRHEGRALVEPRAAERAAACTSRTTSRTRATPRSSAAIASRTTATSCPGSANGIGFEDLIAIEDYEFLNAVARGEPYEPGFDARPRVRRRAGRAASGRGTRGRWEDVVPVPVAAGHAR